MKPIYYLLKHTRKRSFLNSILKSLVLFLVLVGCSTEPADESVMESLTKSEAGLDGSNTIEYDSGQIVLGEEMPDVYSVEAMREAYRQLYPQGNGQFGPDAIQTTHLYVRFRPKNDEEYQSIIKYDLSSIPLNVEIVRGGSSYHDPSIPEDEYTWQYAVVPVGELNTDVEYELLKELYFEPESAAGGNIGMPGAAGPSGENTALSFWETLEDTSERIAAGESVTAQSDGLHGAPGKAKWIPCGNIMVYDDLLKKEIPLENATVVVWRNCRKSTISTDKYGNFVAKKKFKEGHTLWYRIKWESGDKFTIYEGGFYDQAYLCNGKRIMGPWNKVIGETDYKQKQIAAIYRAADRAYNGSKDYLGMKRPDFGGQIAIRYVDGSGSGTAARFRGLIAESNLFPSVKVWGKDGKENYVTSNSIIRAVSHELGHANHYAQLPGVFRSFTWDNLPDNFSESWAVAVAYYISKKEYEELGHDIDTYETLAPYTGPGMPGMPTVPYALGDPGMPGMPGSVTFVAPSYLNKQSWPYDYFAGKVKTDRINYSSLLIDLIDDNNQAEHYKRKYKTSELKVPRDKVKGFTMGQIQSVLGGIKNVDQLRGKVKELNKKLTKPNSEKDIDQLFDDHIKHW